MGGVREIGTHPGTPETGNRPVLEIIERRSAIAGDCKPEGTGQRQRRSRVGKEDLAGWRDDALKFRIDENIDPEILLIVNNANYLWK